jgi:hypothetical protein
VHPRLYPFVLKGPLCVCGHRRVLHVGVHPRYRVLTYDLGCSECELCERYSALEAIDQEAESRRRDEILRQETHQTAIHRRITSVVLAATVFMVPMVAWKPTLFLSMIIPIVFASVANTGVAALAQWRRGDLNGFEVVVQGGLSVGIIALVIALVGDFPAPITTASLAIVVAFVFAFALCVQRAVKRAKHTFDAMFADLHGRLGDDDT